MEENHDNSNISKRNKLYNISTEELGLPSMKELFNLFYKKEFQEEANSNNRNLNDALIWHLIVNGKDYHSKCGTEFMSGFQEIVNIYCKENYD